MKTSFDLITCAICGGPLTDETIQQFRSMLEIFGEEIATTARRCDYCDADMQATHAARRESERVHKRKSLIHDVIPIDYRRTDVSRIPMHMRGKLDYTFPDGKGLWIEGVSGTHKSRLAYEIIRRRILDGTLPSVSVLRGMQFSDTVEAKWSHEEREKNDAIGRLRNASTAALLYIDDIDKIRATPSTCNALLAILEDRHSERLPVMVSTQANGSTLLQKFVEGCRDNETAPSAILRRLIERTSPVLSTPK